MATSFSRTLLTLALGLTLWGCASSGTSPTLSKAEQLTAQQSAFDAIRNRMQEALSADNDKKDLPWFAQSEYEKASDALEDAKEAYANFSQDPALMDDSGLFDSLNYGQQTEQALKRFQSHYDNALKLKSMILEVMAEAFENRSVLTELDAKEHYAKETGYLRIEMKQVVDLFAEGKTEKAQKSLAELLASQHELEVKLVKEKYFSALTAKFEQQRKERYPRTAPQSWLQSQTLLAQLELYIEQQPRELKAIALQAEQAEQSLARLDQRVSAINQLDELDKNSFEDYVLAREAELSQLRELIGGKETRALSFKEQAATLKSELQSLLDQHHETLQRLQQANASSATALEQQYQTLLQEHDNIKLQNVELAEALSLLRQQLQEQQNQLQAQTQVKPTLATTKPIMPVAPVAASRSDEPAAASEPSAEELFAEPDQNNLE